MYKIKALSTENTFLGKTGGFRFENFSKVTSCSFLDGEFAFSCSRFKAVFFP
jgi:hypothetical protein